MAAQSEISQQLCFVDRDEAFNRFDLEDQTGCNHNVHPIFQGEPPAFVDDGQSDLTFKRQTSLG